MDRRTALGCIAGAAVIPVVGLPEPTGPLTVDDIRSVRADWAQTMGKPWAPGVVGEPEWRIVSVSIVSDPEHNCLIT